MFDYQKLFIKAIQKPNIRRCELQARISGIREFIALHYFSPESLKRKGNFLVYDSVNKARFFIKRRLAKVYYKKLLNTGMGNVVLVELKKNGRALVKIKKSQKVEKITMRVVAVNEYNDPKSAFSCVVLR